MKSIICFLFILFHHTFIIAQPVFDNDSLLVMSLKLNLKKILKDRGDSVSYHQAKITLIENEVKKEIETKVKTRGNYRKKSNNCDFPPLMINFKKKNTKNTLFEGANKIKMVTHCSFQDYIVKEYLTYQIYNLLTDYSFKTRLCKVTYEDIANNKKTEESYAILIEGEKELATRLNGKLLDKPKIVQRGLDTNNIVLFALFQYMIGNTDWMVYNQHNLKIYKVNTSRPIAIPYDFDYCGLVNANYAVPHESLNIKSVRERLYRGIGYKKEVFDKAIIKFKEAKKEIINLYVNCTYLSKSDKENSIKYIEEFYKIIEDDKKVKNIFIDVKDKYAGS